MVFSPLRITLLYLFAALAGGLLVDLAASWLLNETYWRYFLVVEGILGIGLSTGVIYLLTRRMKRYLDRSSWELAEARHLTEAMLRIIPDAVYVKDSKGRYTLVNGPFAQLVEVSEEEILGRRAADLFSLTATADVEASDRALLHGGNSIVKMEFSSPLADGKHYFQVAKTTYHGMGNRPRGIVGVVRDITDGAEQNRELRRTNEELESRVATRTADLVEANRELEAFVYSVSHDLRAPLRAVATLIRTLMEDCGPSLASQPKDALERISTNVVRMTDTVEALLTLSRVNRTDLTPVSINLTALTNAVVEELIQNEPSRQVKVTVEQGLRVLGDRQLLRLALRNLLDNAWKYTRRTSQPRVTVRSAPYPATGFAAGFIPFTGTNPAPSSGPQRCYCVEDNGVGFDPNQVDRLFRPFQRLHRNEEFEGHGIGLAILARIIQRHGGQVWAESAEEQGACFCFCLPDPDGDGPQ